MIELRVKLIVLVDTLGLAINPIVCCCSARNDYFAVKSNTDFELFTHVLPWKIQIARGRRKQNPQHHNI